MDTKSPSAQQLSASGLSQDSKAEALGNAGKPLGEKGPVGKSFGRENPSREEASADEAYERDYSKEDLVDLIDQPEWKTILIDLVKKEKMDAWDIDVSDLAEKYLKKINELEHSSLRVPANAILACAILLKTKSKYLNLSSIEDEEEEKLTEEQKEMFLEEVPDLMASRSFREGKISLDELVSSIEDIIDSSKPKKQKQREVPRMELELDDFSIEDTLDDVMNLIQSKADSEGLVMFNDLLENSESPHLVETFLAVLFLMNKGRIVAYQTEFFGDIFVQVSEAEQGNEGSFSEKGQEAENSPEGEAEA